LSQNPELPRQYCSISSSLAQEPLIGSASRTDYWILLEYPYPPPEKALHGNHLSDEINRYLSAVQSALPESRTLLIRRKSSKAGSHPLLYLADGREGQTHLYKFPLSDYRDVLKLDIPGILARGPTAPDNLSEENIFLVCTNGKRDPCCLKWGLPLLNILQEHVGEAAWQTSHVGGHRFAPNMICLPHGFYYGRVPQDQVTRIADRHLTGHITLENFRGSAAYPAPAQAAEYFLRLETREDRIGAYRLDNFSATAENHWEMRFMRPLDQTMYQIEVESFHTGTETFESCSTPSERKAVLEFRLHGSIRVS
jgi:hypothetical protein